jgi:glutamate racemase
MPFEEPVGFFDSGVGGLSVMREVRRLLPAEDLVYFADSAHCPYGLKPPGVIRARAFAICDFLLARGAKLLVIASNTTSIAALDDLSQRYNLPIVGIEPAVKPAVAATRNGRIGILATGVTLAGDRFNSLIERFGNGVEIYPQACPGLVEVVETGGCNKPEAEYLLRTYLSPLLARDVDTIVLGCTHYPFLRPVVERLAGKNISVIDSGEAVAQHVVRVLRKHGLLQHTTLKGKECFFTSGEPGVVEPVVRFLWGDPGVVVERAAI